MSVCGPCACRPSENVPVEMPPSKPPSTASRTRQRHKRIARSQIPTKAVEMPGGVDALDVEVGAQTRASSSHPRLFFPSLTLLMDKGMLYE